MHPYFAGKAVRLKELMDEFFEITRFSLEDMVLDQNPVNVSMMLEQIADEAYAVLAEKGLRCEVDIHEDLTVTGDADKLARYLTTCCATPSITATRIRASGSVPGRSSSRGVY